MRRFITLSLFCLVLSSFATPAWAFPFGLPPVADDALLAKVAPDDCLFYLTWNGSAAPDAKSTNATERFFAEPEVKLMLNEIHKRLRKATASAEGTIPVNPQATYDLASAIIHRPTAIFLKSVDIQEGGDKVDVEGGLLINFGDDIGKLTPVLKQINDSLPPGLAKTVEIAGATFNRAQVDPDAPELTWGVRGRYLVIGVGKNSVEGIFSRATSPAPTWLSDLQNRLTVERRSTLMYINLGSSIQMALEQADDPKIVRTLNALGLSNLDAISAVNGLSKDGMIGRTLLSVKGDPTGLFTILDDKPLKASDLAPIPKDAYFGAALKFDIPKTVAKVREIATQIDPLAGPQINEAINEAGVQFGIDLEKDVLEPLGDVWCISHSPSEGGFLVGLTIAVSVDDAATLAKTHAKLLPIAKGALGEEDMEIKSFAFAGETIHYLSGNDGMVFPASWCLTKDQLYISSVPQNIKAVLLRGADFESVAKTPEVSRVLEGGGATLISYSNNLRSNQLFYPYVQILSQMMPILAQEVDGLPEGLEFDSSLLPTLPTLLKYSKPSVSTMWHAPDGFEMSKQEVMPSVSVGSYLPMMAGFMLPAISSARGAARQMQSMNNAKQMSLAMFNYESTHRHFPAQATTKDGKKLLSWRVELLPYLEERELYEQFKKDEPWDSPHNKKLLSKMPEIFKSPSGNAPEGYTHYLAPIGKGAAMSMKPKGVSMRDLSDGTSNTVSIIEVDDAAAVPWTKPEDYNYDPEDPTVRVGDPEMVLGGLRDDGTFLAAFYDGHVSAIDAFDDPDKIKAKFTANAGD